MKRATERKKKADEEEKAEKKESLAEAIRREKEECEKRLPSSTTENDCMEALAARKCRSKEKGLGQRSHLEQKQHEAKLRKVHKEQRTLRLYADGLL